MNDSKQTEDTESANIRLGIQEDVPGNIEPNVNLFNPSLSTVEPIDLTYPAVAENVPTMIQRSPLPISAQTPPTEESNQSFQDNDPANPDGLLRNLLKTHKKKILLFISDSRCTLSQQVLTILEEELSERCSINVLDVEELTGICPNFIEALEQLTGNSPPLLFYKKKCIGNYFDVMNSQRFDRLDLLIEPPQCPMYHVVIIGNNHGARSVLCGLKKHEFYMKIAVIEVMQSQPKECLKGLMPRQLLWDCIRNLKDYTPEENSYFTHRVFENKEKDCVSLEKQCREAGVDFYRGTFQFLSSDLITFTSCSTTNENLPEVVSCNMVGMNYIICGGLEPCIPEFEGAEYCIPLETFIYGGDIPTSAIIFGNTPEVFEMAYLIALSGGEVVVMDGNEEWLPELDRKFVRQIVEGFSDLPVKFIKFQEVYYIRKIDFQYKIKARLQNGEQFGDGFYECIIIDYTRISIAESIDLEQADVNVSRRSRKILVNEHYISSNPSIYAFGDIACGHPSHPNFEIAAGIKVVNIIMNGRDDYPVPLLHPNIIFTPVEYAFIGETENSIKLTMDQKLVVNVAENPFFIITLICIRVIRASREVDYIPEDDRVVGLHILGRNVSPMIIGLNKMMESGITKEKLVGAILRSKIMKKLKIRRLSFSSRKIRKPGHKIKKSDLTETDSDDNSLFIQRVTSKSNRSIVSNEGWVDNPKNKSYTHGTMDRKSTDLSLDIRFNLMILLIPCFILNRPKREINENQNSLLDGSEEENSGGELDHFIWVGDAADHGNDVYAMSPLPSPNESCSGSGDQGVPSESNVEERQCLVILGPGEVEESVIHAIGDNSLLGSVLNLDLGSESGAGDAGVNRFIIGDHPNRSEDSILSEQSSSTSSLDSEYSFVFQEDYRTEESSSNETEEEMFRPLNVTPTTSDPELIVLNVLCSSGHINDNVCRPPNVTKTCSDTELIQMPKQPNLVPASSNPELIPTANLVPCSSDHMNDNVYRPLNELPITRATEPIPIINRTNTSFDLIKDDVSRSLYTYDRPGTSNEMEEDNRALRGSPINSDPDPTLLQIQTFRIVRPKTRRRCIKLPESDESSESDSIETQEDCADESLERDKTIETQISKMETDDNHENAKSSKT